MEKKVQQALENDLVIDITTKGRRSGKSRRIEIWYHNIDGRLLITGMPGRRSWFANMKSNPHITFHLKQSAQADIPADVRIIDDEAERRKILTVIIAGLDGEHDLEKWVRRSPLVEVLLSQD
ncbi:MAG: nitroreductase family deazaflavin-dependent oxidoreductase [Acidiferrobacteraceae bacterium]|jgi:hypothetical protein|nr:nitroreductase family deazaflavin-dependent oxidoreductase [Acidiferrobacteraceae bacterium]|tara:strand:- start:359 stop:724 length:366 start_codon:yes stop_codon:yes gene_type:complete